MAGVSFGRIREQDFGNFQDPDKTLQCKKDRYKFGSFYYRFPDGGESCADVYDRVCGFLDTLKRHWTQHTNINNYVLVVHGLTISALLFKLCGYSIDDFYTFKNFTNGEFCVLEKTLNTAHPRLHLNQTKSQTPEP